MSKRDKRKQKKSRTGTVARTPLAVLKTPQVTEGEFWATTWLRNNVPMVPVSAFQNKEMRSHFDELREFPAPQFHEDPAFMGERGYWVPLSTDGKEGLRVACVPTYANRNDVKVDRFYAKLLRQPKLLAELLEGRTPAALAPLLTECDIPAVKARAVDLSKVAVIGVPDMATAMKMLIPGFINMARWMEEHPRDYLNDWVGPIDTALQEFGIAKGRLTTMLPRNEEEIYRDEAMSLGPVRIPTKPRARTDLLTFGLQAYRNLADTTAEFLPEQMPHSYLGRRLYIHSVDVPLRENLRTILAKTRSMLSTLFHEAERTELDFETNERRPATSWERWCKVQGVSPAGLAGMRVEASSDGNPLDCDFVLLFREEVALDDADGTETTLVERRVEGLVNFMPIALSMPRWFASKAPDAMLLWRAAARMAGRLLWSGVTVPTPVVNDRTLETNCTWLPALLLDDVREAVTEFAGLCEPFAKAALPPGALAPGKYLAHRAALQLLTKASFGLLRAGVGSGRGLDGYVGNVLLGLRFGSTDTDRIESGQVYLNFQVNRSNMRRLCRTFRPIFLRSALELRPTVDLVNLGGGKIRAEFGFIDKYANPEGAHFLSAKMLRERPALYPKLALVQDDVVETYGMNFPTVARLAKSEDRAIELTTAEAEDFLFNEVPKCALAGMHVRLPRELSNMLEPKLVAVVGAGKTLSTKGLLDKHSLADFTWEAAVGEKRISLQELNRLVEKAGHIVSYGDAFVYLSEAAAERIKAHLTSSSRVSSWEKLRALLTGFWEDAVVEPTEPVKARLEELFNVEDIAPPAGFAAVLRPYQLRGYSWLMKNLRLGLGALIADDMGLGKTVQVIATLQAMKEADEFDEKKAMVVVPASVMTNWARELARFAPDLTVGLYHGQSRKLPDPDAMPDVTLTSYRILANDLEELNERDWRLLVLDEAQAVKNHTTAQAVAVRAFRAPQVIAMSGTPVENRLQEFWSIMSSVQPKLLGTLKEFRETFSRPIEETRSLLVLERFRRLTKPFMIRRMKTDKDVISDLPERETIDWYVNLTPVQAALYEDCLKVSLTDLEKLREEAEAAEDEAKQKLVRELELKRRGNILRMITHLKQITNSPSHFQKQLTNATPDSGKAKALLDILAQSRAAERKVLVFTQYVEMGELLQRWIGAASPQTPDFLHGGVPVAERQKMVDRFQNDPDADVLILSLKAGGLGLNLTAASVVIHYDLWWNPAVEAQANDRAYRIGQTRDVLVYRFITAGTFEERLNTMIAKKRELADITVTSGEAWIGDLSNREIEEIFRITKGEVEH